MATREGSSRRGVARARALRAGLVVGATALGLLFGELGLRLADLPHAGPFLQEFYGEGFKLMAYDANPSGALDLDLRDARVRERWAPRLTNAAEFEASYRATPWAVAFEMNSQGFREKKLEPKRPGMRRIAIVGDSFTAGHGLPNAFAYPRLLEVRLQRAAEHGRTTDALAHPVEVLNLGRGNTDLPAIARSADFALRHLAPDVLVYGYFLNDPIRTLSRDGETPIHDMLDAGWIAAKQTRSMIRIGDVPRGRARVVDLIRRFTADRRVTEATIAWYRRLHQPAAWKPTLDRIVAMERASEAQGARFVLLLLPLPFEIARSPFAEAHRSMKTAAEAEGVEVLDALPALAAYSDEDLRLHPRDRHPSPVYTRVVAELLADALSTTGAAEPRERSPR